MSVVVTGLVWGEGIRVHHGSVWLSDPQGGSLWTNSSGAWKSYPLRSQSNGLWLMADGSVVGAIQRERRIGLWNGEQFGPYADLEHVAHGPLGDMVGDKRGGLYVGDVGYASHNGEPPTPGRLIYVGAHASPAIVAAEGVEFPNGLALIEDGATLVVAETWNQRLLAFDVAADGTLTGRRIFADLKSQAPEAHPDGICAGDGNSVWVCALDAHALLQVDKGEIVRTLDTGAGIPIACALQADDTLYATVADPHGMPFMDAIAAKLISCSVHTFSVAEASKER